MKVLFVTKFHIGLSCGGIQRKMERIAECLSERDVEVIFHDIWKNQIPDVDVVHVFTTFGGIYPFVREAKLHGKPVIMSPVFAPYDIPLWQMQLRVKSAVHIPGWLMDYRLMNCMFNAADAILPLHSQESHRIHKCFSIPYDKLHIVPNGTDNQFANGDAKLFTDRYGWKDYILQVEINRRQQKPTCIN